MKDRNVERKENKIKQGKKRLMFSILIDRKVK
jgi:hypothetical protein